MRPRSISYRVALGGIIASLCLLAMFLTGVIPIFYILLPMIAGLLLSIMVTDPGTRWALLPYLSVGVLSLFMTPNKDAAMIFLLFFGHYPIVVPFLQKIRLPFLRILLKLLLFNGCMLAYFGIMVYVLFFFVLSIFFPYPHFRLDVSPLARSCRICTPDTGHRARASPAAPCPPRSLL